MENPPLVLRPAGSPSACFRPPWSGSDPSLKGQAGHTGSEVARLQARTCGVLLSETWEASPALSVLGGRSKHTFTCSPSWDQPLEEQTGDATGEFQ